MGQRRAASPATLLPELGDNPGQRTQDDAAAHDVETLTEDEFEELLDELVSVRGGSAVPSERCLATSTTEIPHC